MPQVNEWQNRPLEEHFIVTKAAYVVFGINSDGYKEVLGIGIGGNESSKFWLGVLNDLKFRGIKRVDLFCVDGLSGFREAINAAFPFADIQRCIIHQIRSLINKVRFI